MSFSYDNTLATDTDRVRFRLGDTVEATALLADEEIDYYLDTLSYSEDATVGALAQALLAQTARDPKSVRLPDGTSADFSHMLDTWQRFVTQYGSADAGLRIRKLARPQLIDGTEYT